MVIWKFKLQTIDKQAIEIPANAEFLTVQTQNGEPYLWAMVDTNESVETREIEIYGTGQTLSETTGKYIGTYQLADDKFIFHVFESI